MRFKLHAPTAWQVSDCVQEYKVKNVQLGRRYIELAEFIHDNKLNQIEDQADPAWEVLDGTLHEMTINLLEPFSHIDSQDLLNTCARSWEAAKVAMAFYRYIRDLNKFEKDGFIRIPVGWHRKQSTAAFASQRAGPSGP